LRCDPCGAILARGEVSGCCGAQARRGAFGQLKILEIPGYAETLVDHDPLDIPLSSNLPR
jgi:hypothetical protein